MRTVQFLLMAALAVATPASSEWLRVTDIPATPVFSVRATGDTLTASADTTVYVSTNGGTSWRRSAKPVSGVRTIESTWVRNGRIYAGTFGQGVHVSDDLGASWQPFNEGLVGGILDSQLDVVDLQARGDSLFAATAGAGVYVRGFAAGSTWHRFGQELEPNQASNVNSLALGGSRLLTLAGANGQVFFCERGDADWSVSDLDNQGLHPGVAANRGIWTGRGWVVGTNRFLFLSAAGQEPWTIVDPGLGPLAWTAFAASGGRLFGAFDVSSPTTAVIMESDDDGATWQRPEVFPGVLVFQMEMGGQTLYAARTDGLWRNAATTSVSDGPPAGRLHFALAGRQPFGGRARLRFELPRAGNASVQLFDVQGRAAGERIEGFLAAGSHVVDVDARRLSSGVYWAVLSAAGTRNVVRLVHLQ